MLVFAIYRLAPIVLDLERSPMSQLHWAALIISVAYMAYAEGYKGFHLSFAPRVVIRASYLRDNPRIGASILHGLYLRNPKAQIVFDWFDRDDHLFHLDSTTLTAALARDYRCRRCSWSSYRNCLDSLFYCYRKQKP